MQPKPLRLTATQTKREIYVYSRYIVTFYPAIDLTVPASIPTSTIVEIAGRQAVEVDETCDDIARQWAADGIQIPEIDGRVTPFPSREN